MNSRVLKLICIALGSLMLVLLQTTAFQNAIGFTNIIGIKYLGDIAFLLAKMLSFAGVILFTATSIKLIFIKIKNE